jgi:hypothetical protein
MRTNRSTYDYSKRARERQIERQNERQIEQHTKQQADHFKNEPVYYSFTMSSAQCADGAHPRILAECVRDASPAAFARVAAYIGE